jgi:hypothetical protein
MLTLHSHNLSNIARAHGIGIKESIPKKGMLKKHHVSLVKKNQGFIDLPDDAKTIKNIQTFKSLERSG